MEIHELNTFSGTLGASDYFATDNGNDTSKVSAADMFAPLNARIDNIIAGGTAPSEAEVTDARLGATDLGGVQYASLGAAVRGQAEALFDIDNNTKDFVADTNDFFASILTSPNILDNSKWISGGFFNPNGSISSSSNYKYQYLRVPTYGTYITTRQSAFGSNRDKLPLFDADKNYLKYITGTLVSGTNVYQFDLPKADFQSGGVYLGLSISGNVSISFCPGTTLYNANHYPAPTWTVDKVKTKLYKKVLICDGDSLGYGNKDLPNSQGAWFGRLCNENLMSGKNYSVNGASITAGLVFQDQSPRHSVCEGIDTMYSEYPNADYILLEGGVNDADLIGSITGGTIPEAFGTWNDAEFNSSRFDIYTFCGAVDMLFYKAVTYYAGKKIGFIIPPQMGTSYSVQKNRRAYFDEIIKIATKWHIPVLDLWKEGTIDCRVVADYDPSLTAEQNISAGKFYADGQHLTSNGYDLIQNKIQKWCEYL